MGPRLPQGCATWTRHSRGGALGCKLSLTSVCCAMLQSEPSAPPPQPVLRAPPPQPQSGAPPPQPLLRAPQKPVPRPSRQVRSKRHQLPY